MNAPRPKSAKAGSNPVTLRCACGFPFRLFPSAIDECEEADGVHCPKCRARVRTREPVSEETRRMLAEAVAHCLDRSPEVRKWVAAQRRAAQAREDFFARKREEHAALTQRSAAGEAPRMRAENPSHTREGEAPRMRAENPSHTRTEEGRP